MFGCLLVAQLVVIGVVAPLQPWIWLLPLTLPFAALLIDDRYHQLKELVAAQFETSARESKLVAIRRDQRKTSSRDSERLPLAEPASTEATL
jgi:hypothetical protein